MTVPESRWQLDAFVDGELDLVAQLEMEARLEEDAELRSRVQGMRRLQEALRGQADYYTAPPELRARVQALVAPTSRPQEAAGGRNAWRWWAGAATAVAVAALATSLVMVPLSAEQRLREDVVASHVRATLGERSVDVASSERHVLKPWLSSRLDFSPDVRESGGAHDALLGGRIDYVGGRPVAVLVWRVGAHAADDFTWPSPAADHAPVLSSTRGFNVAHWTRHGMAHWLISDLNREELAQLARRMAAD